MRHRTVIAFALLTILIIITVAIGISRALPQTPRLEKGIYLYMGSGCIQVDGSETISLFMPMGFSTGNVYEMQMRPQGERLILYSRLVKRANTEAYVSPKTDNRAREWNPMVELVPSKNTPGDWDLVYQHFLTYYLDIPRPLDFSKEPLVSFLHRIDNERVVEYLKYRKTQPAKSQDSDRILQMASAIVQSHPKDPFAHIFLMDALIEKKDSDGLAAEMRQWKNPLGEVNTLTYLTRKAESSSAALQYLKDKQTSRRNAYFFLNGLVSDQMDLAARISYFPEALDCSEYVQVFPLFVDRVPDYLSVQITTKAALVAGEFFMLQGKKQQGLRTLASVYRLGQLMNQGGTLINRLIGMHIRGIALQGLNIYVLNCMENPADFADLDRLLQLLEKNEKVASFGDFLYLEPAGSFASMIVGGNYTNALTRHRRADAGFRLLNMATAAKKYYVNKGSFPSTNEELESLDERLESFLPKGIPEDPFSSSTLKFTANPTTFTCYSVGPDKADDSAVIEYDPTNGTLSRGDISIKVPRERTYPFPRNGVHASTREELLRQFPNGLPPDIFASTKGKPLGVTSATPLCIYSYGPDTNEYQERKAIQEGKEYYPDTVYDPTNGATSHGDLMFVVGK